MRTIGHTKAKSRSLIARDCCGRRARCGIRAVVAGVSPANAKGLQPTRLPLHNSPLKNPKKSLATPMGTVTNGVILRALGGYMRKFKTRRPFRLLLILTGSLLLLAALAPRANATLIAYYNFEGTPTPGYPVNLDSHPPAVAFPSGNTMTLSFNVNSLTAVHPGLPQNLFPGDPAPNLTALGLSRSGANSPAHFDIPLNSSQGFFQDMTVSFAINALGN